MRREPYFNFLPSRYIIVTVKSRQEKWQSCPVGPPAWRYQCGACGAGFEMPAPSGPAEEKARTCPICHSKNIKITECVKSAACPPGG